jgi:ribosomal protein S18 acetylase RimI-like enzyme
VASALEQALAFQRDLAKRCSTKCERFEYGEFLVNEKLPRVEHMNVAYLDPTTVDLHAPKRMQLAYEIANAATNTAKELGLPHVQLTVEDDGLGAILQAGFSGIGWATKRVAVMAPGDAVTLDAATSEARQLTEGEFAQTRMRFLRDERREDEDVLHDLLASDAIVAANVETEYYGRLVDDTVASCCELYAQDGVVQLENLFTVADFQRRSYAREVLAKAYERALELDGALIFFVVEASNEQARPLYTKSGFADVGFMHEFGCKLR